MEIIYRKARKEDATDIAEMTEKLVGNAADLKKLEDTLEMLSKKEEYYVVTAYCDGKVIGMSQGMVCHDICEDCRNFLVIENVFIQEEYRGQHIAEGIFNELEKWGRLHNCYYAILVSGNERERAHGFYQKIGYEKEGGFRKYL